MESTARMRYRVIPLRDVPYAALDTSHYGGVASAVKEILGRRAGDPLAHEEAFWTPEYRRALDHHLVPRFAAFDIVAVAGAADAQLQPHYDSVLTVDTMPPPPVGPDSMGMLIARWAARPPELTLDPQRPGRWVLSGVRHRMTVLRYALGPDAGDVPILVRYRF